MKLYQSWNIYLYSFLVKEISFIGYVQYFIILGEAIILKKKD